jgi:integrase
MGWREQQLTAKENEGLSAFDDRELRQHGWTVQRAIAFALEHLRKTSASVPIIDAIAALVEDTRAAGYSADYCQRLAYRPGKLLAAFPNVEKRSRTDILRLQKVFPALSIEEGKHEKAINVGASMASITTDQLNNFLADLKTPDGRKAEPGTRNTFRRDICTLWSYGASGGRNWCVASTASDTIKAKEVTDEIQILEVGQVERLLRASDPEIVPANAISAFCTIRQAELEKLDWPRVDLEERIITIDAKIAKTSARRTITIPENCVEWLRPYAKKEGRIVPANYRNLFDRARVRAGFEPSSTQRSDKVLQKLLVEVRAKKIELAPWPVNAFRHSSISYKLAKEKNYALVAAESGNSPKMIKEHYDGQAKPSAAAAYYAIMPDTPANVVSLVAA